MKVTASCLQHSTGLQGVYGVAEHLMRGGDVETVNLNLRCLGMKLRMIATSTAGSRSRP